jgi:PAS domain S-box-containing protein
MDASTPELRKMTPRWLRLLPAIYLVAGLTWIIGSDVAVGWLYRDDLRALVHASTLKGALFVVLTATLFYVVLAMRRADFEPGPRGLDPADLRKPLLAFAIVGLAIATMGYSVYLLEAEGVRKRATESLRTTAKLVSTEISLWHEGRVSAMRQVAASPYTAPALSEWRTAPTPLAEDMLYERLQAIRQSQGFSAVTVVDTAGRPLISAGASIHVDDALRAQLDAALLEDGVVSNWAVAGGTPSHTLANVDFVTALRNRRENGHPVVAFIVSRADIASAFRSSMTGPASGAAQLALVRLAGNGTSVLTRDPATGLLSFSSAARSARDRAIVEVARAGIAVQPAAPALGGQLVAVGVPVAGTPWHVVSAIDSTHVAEQVRRLMFLIAGLSALGFVATAALVLPWWRETRASAAAQVRLAETRVEEVETRLGWITRHANDPIILVDAAGVIIDANARAVELYRYARSELIGLPVFELRPASSEHRMRARRQFETVMREGSLVFQATHVRKDGTPIPVEVSSRRMEIGGQNFVQSIVRDVSERERVEQLLRDSEAQYRMMFASNPLPMWVFDAETLRFLAVNAAATMSYGYSADEFLSMTIVDIRPQEDVARLDEYLAANRGDSLRHAGLWRHRRKRGEIIEVEVSSHSINFSGRPARLVLANEVTARVRAERALRSSEERYRSLFENASDGVVLLAAGRRILTANPEFELMTGYSRDEMAGMDLGEMLDEQEHARLERGTEVVRAGGLPPPSTWTHRRKDGSRFVAEVRIRTLPGGYLLATVRDLTEILEARRRIERQRDLYDLLSQCNQAIVRVADRSELLERVAQLAVERGRFLFAWVGRVEDDGRVVPIARCGEDHGYIDRIALHSDPSQRGGQGPTGLAIRSARPVVVNDFLGDPLTEQWHEVARECGVRASAAYPISMRGRVTAVLMLYSGEIRCFDDEISTTLVQMAADVSHALDALQTRRELEDSRLLIQSVVDASDALVFVFDLEGRAILVNDACIRAMGCSRSEVMGRNRQAVLPLETALAHEANDRNVIESGRAIVVEERNVKDGQEVIYLSVKFPLRDIDGRVYAVGGISTEITDLRRVQRELAEANLRLEEKVAERTRDAVEARERAEAADQAKTHFLSSMSHELRSPLHSIIGFTSVLLEGLGGELMPEQREHVQVVSDAAQHLLAIINDLLDMSRIEAGAIVLESRSFDLGQLVARVVQRFSLQARAKGLELCIERAAAGIGVTADERRVEQVVSNLVSNAIKYTPAGRVTVGVSQVPGQVRVEVIDTGPGISEEDRSRLFKRFSQLRPARNQLVEGAGLGLAIAAGLAEAMGGSIELQSEGGRGSVFTLHLPHPGVSA